MFNLTVLHNTDPTNPNIQWSQLRMTKTNIHTGLTVPQEKNVLALTFQVMEQHWYPTSLRIRKLI